MPFFKRDFIFQRDYQKGQVLLISLLVLSVVLVVGLSLAARTINTLRTSKAEDSSQKAFAAAEAGLEQSLTAIENSFQEDLSDDQSYQVTINELLGDEFQINAGGYVVKDDSADIWLSEYPDYLNPWSGNLTIYWGSPSDVCVDRPEEDNTMAALEIVLISGSKASPTIDHFAYDPCDSRRNGQNNFSPVAPGATVAGRDFAYSFSLPVASGLLARVIPIYAGTYVGVTGGNLPPQGTVVTSVGISGDTKRKIVSFRGYPKVPVELYPYLIFSP